MAASADMRVFACVVDCSSFSGAAAELGITPSAVSRVISRLEDRLGVRLLQRTTRRLSLTPEGETYHLRAKEILAAIEETEVEVSSGSLAPRGRLRVNCVAPFAHFYMAEALPDFMTLHPKIEVELAVTDRVIDLVSEGVDVAIRTGPVSDPSLVVRKIGEIERGIYAAPAYLARHGTPRSPAELAHHSCITLGSMPSGHRWQFSEGERVRLVDVGSRTAVDDAMVVLQLALAGAGIIRLTDLTVCHAVRDGRLVQLFRDSHVAEPTPLSAVYPFGRHRMPKIRAFLDFLAARYLHAPWKRAQPAKARVARANVRR